MCVNKGDSGGWIFCVYIKVIDSGGVPIFLYR